MALLTEKQMKTIEQEAHKSTKKTRLKGSRVYLCGAMDRVPDGGVQWRDDIAPWLQNLGIKVINPCDKPIDICVEDAENRELRNNWKETCQYNKLAEEMKLLRAVDLRFVDISDFLIVYLDTDVHACGTYEEIFLANRQKMPILVVIKGGVRNIPDWLFGTLPYDHFFGTWIGLKHYVNHVHSYRGEVKHYKRWFFLDYDKL